MSIKLQNVNYIYGIGTGQEKHALKNINLEINDGEFIGLVGAYRFRKVNTCPAFKWSYTCIWWYNLL